MEKSPTEEAVVAAGDEDGATGNKAKANVPPEVITVDTAAPAAATGNNNNGKNSDAASDATPSKSETTSQARTPKHANKSKDEAADDYNAGGSNKKPASLSDSHHHEHHHQRMPPTTAAAASATGNWNGPPPPPGYQQQHTPPPPSSSYAATTHYNDHRSNMGGGQGGAFQPREQQRGYPGQQQQQAHAPMQVSPGGGRYYYGSGVRYSNAGSGGGFEHQQQQRYPNADFSHAPNYPQQPPTQRGSYGGGGGGGGPPPLYPQQYTTSSQQGAYDGRGPPPASWGPPPFPHGRPPHQQPQQQGVNQPEQYPRGGGSASNNNANFSRAVSSSFDRSIKSGQDKHPPSHPAAAGTEHQRSPKNDDDRGGAPEHHHAHADSGSVSEDASWGQLKQVHSVDEEEMRKRLSKRKDRGSSDKDLVVNRSTSNSSSLTNSPTEGVEAAAAKKAMEKASLDSLSSVTDSKAVKAPSPDGSAPSLELMKCPSGTSTLLLPSHQRSLSHFSLSGIESKETSRKESDEERQDIEDKKDGEDKSGSEPLAKKPRLEGKEKKQSPLSITCSPPTSPGLKKKSDPKMHQPQAVYAQQKGESPAFFDKAPSYTYSMDSTPQLPPHGGGGVPRPDSYPTVPRPGSSASSTITPMNVDGGELRQPPGIGQIPSWEIHGQESFGATSAGGGNPLMGSFSFQQDYSVLGPSASGEQGMMQGPPPQLHGGPAQTLESRNQSFEGGHYHGGGSFARSDSMVSYEGRQMSFDGGHGRPPPYQGSFPPHAPSWGSAASYPAGYGQQQQQQQRMGYPPMMRNYSEDSGARTSPPPGSGSMRMMPPNFPPPPEFRAPPSMVNNKGGPQNTIMTSPYQASPKIGPFGWSKEEDTRLTEIMKKYKNPRDWEPIAKEHNRNRTAKECHERWIRYLKPGVRKGQWTDHEDAVVMEVVTTSTEQPFTRWSDLAQRLPGRVGKQIRDRWVNHLNPAINHLPFSREDDLQLWDGHKKLGKRWVEISTKFFNNTRSENHIKNRWYSASFKKFIANEFGPDAYAGGKSSVKKDSSFPGRNKKAPPRRPGQPMDPSQMEAV